MAHRFLITLSLCLLVGLSHGAKIATSKYYHIQSSDGTFITIGGDNSRNVKVVTEEIHGTDPRQTFLVGNGEDSHLISPQAQNTLSTLVVGMETKSGLVFQQAHGFIPRHQWWMIHDLGGNNTWSIQNVATGLCISTGGKGTHLIGAVCDRSNVTQTWVFSIVEKRSAEATLNLA